MGDTANSPNIIEMEEDILPCLLDRMRYSAMLELMH